MANFELKIRNLIDASNEAINQKFLTVLTHIEAFERFKSFCSDKFMAIFVRVEDLEKFKISYGHKIDELVRETADNNNKHGTDLNALSATVTTLTTELNELKTKVNAAAPKHGEKKSGGS